MDLWGIRSIMGNLCIVKQAIPLTLAIQSGQFNQNHLWPSREDLGVLESGENNQNNKGTESGMNE